MTYLPTTTLTVSPLYYVALAVTIATTVVFFILALKAWGKAPVIEYREPLVPTPEEPFYTLQYGKVKQVNDPVPVYDEESPATKKWNSLRAWTIFFALLTIVPGIALYNANENTNRQAEKNLVANLGVKYGITAIRDKADIFYGRSGPNPYLDARQPKSQYLSAKVGGTMDVYQLIQDPVTSEPTIYSGNFSKEKQTTKRDVTEVKPKG